MRLNSETCTCRLLRSACRVGSSSALAPCGIATSGKKLTRPENGCARSARACASCWLSRTTKRCAHSPSARSISGAYSRFTVRKSAIMPMTVDHGPASGFSINSMTSRTPVPKPSWLQINPSSTSIRLANPLRCWRISETWSLVRSRNCRRSSCSCLISCMR